MLTLKSQQIGFSISTTDLDLIYTESKGVKVTVGCIEVNTLNDSENCFCVEFFFPIVAEAKCVTMNFYEANYEDFNIIKSDDYLLDSGFYEVVNSSLLKDKERIYDPRNRLSLRHYILTGNDSYVELIATSYVFNKLM